MLIILRTLHVCVCEPHCTWICLEGIASVTDFQIQCWDTRARHERTHWRTLTHTCAHMYRFSHKITHVDTCVCMDFQCLKYLLAVNMRWKVGLRIHRMGFSCSCNRFFFLFCSTSIFILFELRINSFYSSLCFQK